MIFKLQQQGLMEDVVLSVYVIEVEVEVEVENLTNELKEK
jgi:hypothetical protein